MLMNELNGLKKAEPLADFNARVQDIERVTFRWADLPQTPFNEGHKLSKLKMLLPTTVYNYIAVNLRNVTTHDEIIQLIEAQTKDPTTGLMRSEKYKPSMQCSLLQRPQSIKAPSPT